MIEDNQVLTPNLSLLLSAKTNRTLRRTLVSPLRIHSKYCGMPKGASWVEAMSKYEKFQPITQSVENSVKNSLKPFE